MHVLGLNAKESLTCRGSSHLLLWFESNGRHRHLRAVFLVPADSRQTQRRTLRAARRAVPPAQRLHAAHLVARYADRAFHLHAGQRIALYSPLAEELDTSPLMQLAAARGCELYLPRIAPHANTMRFIAMSGTTSLNRFGIAEPRGSRSIGARWLDLVFLPLLGFDRRGMRLGMGGGYYDRAFAFRHQRNAWRGPRLIGIGFAFQQVPQITPVPHDVRLDAVVTDGGCLFF